MHTGFVPLEVTAKEAAVSIAFKYLSAVLATDAIVITDLFFGSNGFPVVTPSCCVSSDAECAITFQIQPETLK